MGRKQKRFHYIYKTTNILSGKYYYGMHSTDNLEDGYLGSGRRLRYSLNKYGKNNHIREILEFCKDREELANRESELVTLNEIAKEECMNMVVGGFGGGKIWSPEHMKSFSKAGKLAFLKKLENDPEFKEKMKQVALKNLEKGRNEGKIKTGKDVFDWTGKKHSEESKQKMRKTKKGQGKGELNSQYGKCWITNEVENKKIYRGDMIPDGWRLGRVIKSRA